MGIGLLDSQFQFSLDIFVFNPMLRVAIDAINSELASAKV